MITRTHGISKFHIGHFPVGTVVEVECPCEVINKGDYIHPGERYKRKVITVVAVVPNGQDSYLLKATEWSESGYDLYAINMGWVRRIVSRGIGKLTLEDQTKVEQFAKDREDRMKEIIPNWCKRKEVTLKSSTLPVNGNKYRFNHDPGFVALWMHERGYLNPDQQHLYDMEYIWEQLLPHFNVTGGWWAIYTIPKKKFARIMKQVIAKAKISRRAAAAVEHWLAMVQYEKDMAHQDEDRTY